MSHGDVLRSHYVILNCSNLISAPDTDLNPVEFDWNSVHSVLMPNKCIVTLPKIYTVTLGCKKNALENFSAANLALHAQNFASATEKNVVRKFTNRLGWMLHKICRFSIRFSVSQIFPYLDIIQGGIQETIYQRNPHTCIFYPV